MRLAHQELAMILETQMGAVFSDNLGRNSRFLTITMLCCWGKYFTRKLRQTIQTWICSSGKFSCRYEEQTLSNVAKIWLISIESKSGIRSSTLHSQYCKFITTHKLRAMSRHFFQAAACSRQEVTTNEACLSNIWLTISIVESKRPMLERKKI